MKSSKQAPLGGRALVAAVLGAVALTSASASPAFAQRGAEVTADRRFLPTIKFAAGSAALSGYSWASVDVEYLFFTCTNGSSTSIFVAQKVREGSLRTSSTYAYKGRTVNAAGQGVAPNFLRVSGDVLYGGQRIESLSSTVSGYSEIEFNCRDSHNNVTRVGDLARHMSNVADERAVRAFLSMLSVRYASMNETLRARDFETTVDQQIRAEDKATADRAASDRAAARPQAPASRTQPPTPSAPLQPTAAEQQQATVERQRVAEEKRKADQQRLYDERASREAIAQAAREKQAEDVVKAAVEVVGFISAIAEERRVEKARKEALAAERRAEAAELIAGMALCEPTAIAQTNLDGMGGGGGDLRQRACRTSDGYAAHQVKFETPFHEKIELYASSDDFAPLVRIETLDGRRIGQNVGGKGEWTRYLTELQARVAPGAYIVTFASSVPGESGRFSSAVRGDSRYFGAGAERAANPGREVVPCFQAMGVADTLRPGETIRVRGRKSCWGTPFMSVFVESPEAGNVEVQVDGAIPDASVSLYGVWRDSSLDTESADKKGRAKLKKRLPAGLYAVMTTGHVGREATFTMLGKRGTARLPDSAKLHAVRLIPGVQGRVKGVRFFESDRAEVPFADRRYATRFDAATTRSIAPELSLEIGNTGHAGALIVCAIVHDDGTPVGARMEWFAPLAGIKDVSWSTGGIAGVWRPGWYRLFCAADHEQRDLRVLVAIDSFMIRGGRSRTPAEVAAEFRAELRVALVRASADSGVQAVKAEVAGVRFFEIGKGESVPSGNLAFQTVFDAATARYIGVLLVFTHPPAPADVGAKFVCQRIGPDGPAPFQAASFGVLAGSTSMSWSPGGLGWEDPGKFTPGSYSVECFSGGELIAEGAFKVVKTDRPAIPLDVSHRADSIYMSVATASDSAAQAQAVLPLRQAMALGHQMAALTLASMYRYGNGVKPDTAEAVRIYRWAADRGNAVAEFFLGDAYQNGFGVRPDTASSTRWMKASAEQGVAPSQHRMGDKLEYSDTPDTAQAFKWYQLAAAQGHVEGMYRLASMLEKRESTPADREALIWYRRVAVLGDTSGSETRWAGQSAERLETSFESGGRIGVMTFQRGGEHVFSMIFPNGPAAAAGARVLDRLLTVEEEAVVGWTRDSLYQRLEGPIGSSLVVTVARGASNDPVTLSMVRARPMSWPTTTFAAAGARLISTRFYGAATSYGEPGDSAYALVFPPITRYIVLEAKVGVVPNASAARVLALTCDYKDPAGSKAMIPTGADILFDPDQTTSVARVHFAPPGLEPWVAGTHRVQCTSGERAVVNTTFQIK